MTIVNIFNICYIIKAMCFGGHWHSGWQGQPGGGDHGGQWHGCIISVSVIGLSLLPTGVHCLLLHLDGVINLCVVTHIENFKHLSVPTINTTYHSPALLEKATGHSTKHQPQQSPPSNCICHPQCHRPSTHMTWRLSHMFEIQKKLRQPPSPQHITSKLKNISTEVIFHNVSHFPGPLLLVVLAVHSAVDHQTTWA